MNRKTIGSALYLLGGACGIVAIPYRPFLFAPLGVLLLLIGTITTQANRRIASMGLAAVVIGALAGTAIAAAYSRPLL